MKLFSERNGSYEDGNVRNLNRSQLVQRMGIDLRDEIVNKIADNASLDTGQIADMITLRGDQGIAIQTVAASLRFELMTDSPKQKVVAVLKQLESKAQLGNISRAHKPEPEILAERIATRARSGGALRENDIDLTDEEIALVEKRLEGDPSLDVFRIIVEGRNNYKRALEMSAAEMQKIRDRDPVFPVILNKEGFTRIIDEQYGETEGTIAFLDVNDFKSLNDREFGYTFVDKLVLEPLCVAFATQAGTECSSRYGGDEFTLFYPNDLDQQKIIGNLARIFQRTLQSINESDIERHWELLKKETREQPPVDEAEKTDEGARRKRIVRDVMKRIHSLHAKMGTTIKKPKESALIARTRASNVMQEAKRLNETEHASDKLRFPALIDGDEKERTVFSAIEHMTAA